MAVANAKTPPQISIASFKASTPMVCIEDLFNHVRDCNLITNVMQGGAPIATAMKTLAERTKEARERLGMTQQELADAAGVAQGTIGNIERGRGQRPREAAKIARALKVNLDWYLYEEGPMEPNKLLQLAYAQGIDPVLPLELTEVSDTDWAMLRLFQRLPEEIRQEKLTELIDATKENRAATDEILERYGAKGTAPAERVNQLLPPAPTLEGHPPRKVRMVGRKKTNSPK
jgi:transcriptional regulator with XRE-family HTH domain